MYAIRSYYERTERAIQPELLAAIGFVLPGREAAEHLRGEGFVDFPIVEIVQTDAVALEDRRRGMHRTEAHLRRIETGPFRVDDAPDRAQVVAHHGFLRSEQQPGCTVGDLRAVARCDVAELAVEKGP